MMEDAIRFVMNFYEVSRDDAIKYYWDEVEAYMELKSKFEDET